MRRVFLALVPLLLLPPLHGYSVLTHEAIIDTSWDQSIKPLLLERFPQATPDDLIKAHAYAYGGCIIQDMGYYPFGSHFFSDLLHYVRSGDFIVNLLQEAQNLNEYAFALGALAHYAADSQGHPLAVNRAVALQYPKLRRKYGKEVTYEDDPSAHLKVEFGFDVLQVARGNYAPESYHDFIGFKVAKDLLDRGFRDTYDLELKDVFTSLDLAIGTYRHTVSGIIPEMTKVAWAQKKDDLMKATPGLTRRKFIYNISRASYEKEWDREYKKPGIGARILAFVLRIIPKVGPFRAAALKAPTPVTAHFFEDSFNKTLDVYRPLLASQGDGSLSLPNRDFDTGELTRPGEYRMADAAYAKLVIKLADKERPVDPKLRTNILAFYRDLDQPFATKKDAKEWQKTLEALDRIKSQTQGP
ncbi:MAG TPA: zinc dependent phospholipase C family protein [Bryobacteraceae bacterium]